jgi:D-sedoheptulose 7-phosphate isomerase
MTTGRSPRHLRTTSGGTGAGPSHRRVPGELSELFEEHLAASRAALDQVPGAWPRLEGWARRIVRAAHGGGRVLVAGNGGSAALAQHLTSELVGRLRRERAPLSAWCLSAETSTLTAIGNDYGYEEVFARQVRAHGRAGDVLVALSTSGRSPNLLTAVRTATGAGLATLALTGAAPNPLAAAADEAICLEGDTAAVQEAHQVLVHALCVAIDHLAEQAPAVTDGTADVAAVAARVRAAGGTLVAVGGCFDLLHAGHVGLLQQARRLGDALVVLVNSDASVRRLKGPERPIVTERDRVAVLRGLACVDAVELFDEDTPQAALERLRPDVFCKGGDYAGVVLPEEATMARWGGRVEVLAYLDGRSTSGIVHRVRATA